MGVEKVPVTGFSTMGGKLLAGTFLFGTQGVIAGRRLGTRRLLRLALCNGGR